MADLRSLLAGLGYEDVATLLNSGNAVFRAVAAPVETHAAAIEGAIRDRFGFDVRVAVRTPEDLERVLTADPIPGAIAEPSRYLVAFLLAPMPPDRIVAFDPAVSLPEEVRLGDGVVYVWYRDGIGRSTLTGDILERRIGVPMTARNWNTVTKMAALASR